ncbi:mannitol-1-phosphate 5-dehydrogenase [Enterococcus saccharolyticus]|uniref:mannitol-1-phosphate 5-dehydrogenase n=1 Tax=Enterococcus saccharolyticus TaxID=41997 RepID=UPI001E2F5E38|nr:mannitol-1-phosphate 5-dehydrogenase [Enterococcus saccharolyticus]MCD5003024.1 mannitol-1-phosphate 5-dehydrogenase [Enterococcus saccharolyticus]
MKAVHFGAGNIGRGFIGEILFNNNFSINFVDINATLIDALKERNSYEIELASEGKERIAVSNVNGLNNQTEPEAVIAAISHADLVTTAIGPNILPFIAELIAKGIQKRRAADITTPFDVIACENMIGGSQFLFSKVREYLTEEDLSYVEEFVGFPNAAVDRIVPIQHHEDPLFVSVEPFSEWVVDATKCKNQTLQLDGVLYVEDLEPYIERKLFSVNTGHATTAYTGSFYGYQTIGEAIVDERVLNQLRQVLQETGNLLIEKWGFNRQTHAQYTEKIIHRFENPYISDDISRVARTPIRKLGFDERFIRPIREAKERGLSYQHLVDVVAMILHYQDDNDQESVELQQLLSEKSAGEVIEATTKLTDEELIAEIGAAYKKIK